MKNTDQQHGTIKFIGKRMTPFAATVISNAAFNFLKIRGRYDFQINDHGTEFTLCPDSIDVLSNEILVTNVVNTYRAFQDIAEKRDTDEFLD